MLGDYQGAISIWQSLENRNYRRIFLGLHLADAHLRDVTLSEAERRYREIAIALESELADGKQADDLIDAMPGDQQRLTYGVALAWARLGIAVALARRHVGYEEALQQVDQARRRCEDLGLHGDKVRWLANCDRIAGEVLYRKGDVRAARAPLERSLTSAASSEGYFYLAEALFAGLDRKADDENARALALRIRGLADQASKLDFEPEADARIGTLKARLEATAAAKAL
jgi:hypothetical protein